MQKNRVTGLKSIGYSLAPLFLTLTGCSAWHGERLEQATVAAIDDRLRPGMALDEFRREFPDATLIGGGDESKDWLISFNRTCFVCTTADGFRRSRDTYSRIAHFEQGRLKAVNPLPREQRID